MNFEKLRIFYWTGSRESVDDVSPIEAEISQFLASPILAKSDEYVCAVERFELSLNAIPFYDGMITGRPEQILITNVEGDELYIDISFKSYSLLDTLRKLNTLLNEDDDEDDDIGPITFNLDTDGFITCSTPAFEFGITILFPTYLNAILGFSDTSPASGSSIVSTFPRFGLGDNLKRIQITSNLGIFSDTVGQAKTNILTDIDIAGEFQSSVEVELTDVSGTASYPPRSKLIVLPKERRYLNFSSPAPLQSILIRATYVDIMGRSQTVSLPKGGVFAIKLGFYKRQ